MVNSPTATDIYQYKWAKAIFLSADEGLSPPQIAQRVDLSGKKVRERIKAWNGRGLDALQRRKSPGRPRKWGKELGQRIVEDLVKRYKPLHFGLPGDNWTLDTVAQAIERLGWIEGANPEGVRQALKQAGYSFRRVKRWKSSPEPKAEYDRKKNRRDYYLSKVEDPDWAVVFEDEAAGYLVKPYPGCRWMDTQHPHTIPADWTTRGRVGWFGSLDAETGQLYWHFGRRHNTDTMIRHSVELAWNYRGKKYLAMIMDNASYHKSRAYFTWLRYWNRHAYQWGLPKIIPVYLPVGAPWLNRIEPVWWGMQRRVLAGNYFTMAEEMMAHVDGYFEGRNRALAQAA